MDEIPAAETGAGLPAPEPVPTADVFGLAAASDPAASDPAGASSASSASSLRWEVRPAPRAAGVSPSVEALLPVPATEDAAGRPVLEQLTAAVHLTETAAGLQLWPLTDDELGVTLRLLARLTGAIDRCQVALVGEAHTRGTAATTRGGRYGRTTVDWVVCESRGRIPAARAAQLLRVARCAQAIALSGGAHPGTGGLETVYAAFTTGVLPLDKADRISRFYRDVRPVASEDDINADVSILLAAASDDDPTGHHQGITVPELTRAIQVAGQYLKPAPLLDKDETSRRAARALYRSEGPAGMTTYRMLMDPEGAAVIDAALAAHSHPVKSADGERDPRTAPTRRADALLHLLLAGVAAGSSGQGPSGQKAQIVVTIDYHQLQEAVRGAGITDTGQVLSPATIRRLACDAAILPLVLGSDSAPLDLGRTQRLFTGPQRRAITRRDHTCTWTGCTIPAGWCHIHHNHWWSRGGPTDLTNGALLCPRHHTLVHDRDLHATITTTTVTWPT